ncbi:MAG TPA: DNA polymerase III subunit beta [Clostridiaceae bacterium]
MKFLCKQSFLIDAISAAQKAVTGKSTKPILQGLLIKAEDGIITIIGSDIDMSIETKIQADIHEVGSIVVDSRMFGDIIRKLPNDTIMISTSESNLIEIICQKSKFNLVFMNPDEFPTLPKINENIILNIPQIILKNMIKGTIFAIAQEETRPILQGVLFELKDNKLNLVALDGYRLALRKENIENANTINAVIPGKSLTEISKILSDVETKVNITFTTNHILFNLGNTKIISRLLEGEFIKYSTILPTEYNSKVTVKKEELLDCIERASLMSKEGSNNLINIDILENNMVITSNSQYGKVREELNIILEGNTLEIAFNSKYLIDILKNIEEEEIIMEYTSSVSPCIIKNSVNNNSNYLVLPVRRN